MTTPAGGCAASLDADSEGEEGKFYVWSLKEIERALGPADAAPYSAGDSAAFFAAKYDVSRNGNFEILGHSWRAGRLLIPGLASDYAAMIRAALAIFEATGEQSYLDCALTWQHSLDAHYADADHGGYYLTANDAEGLIVRPHSTVDDAIPNHTGLIAQNLVRLAVLTGDDNCRSKADALFTALLPSAAENVFGHLSLLHA